MVCFQKMIPLGIIYRICPRNSNFFLKMLNFGISLEISQGITFAVFPGVSAEKSHNQFFSNPFGQFHWNSFEDTSTNSKRHTSRNFFVSAFGFLRGFYQKFFQSFFNELGLFKDISVETPGMIPACFSGVLPHFILGIV